jgi:putative oxidoreductase
MSTGLLLLRLLLAALLAGHACQKLFGWFRGAGRAGSAVLFDAWGFRPALAMVTLAGCAELLGAASIAAGLLTPGGCAVVLGTMIVAASPNLSHGLWAHLGGFEVTVIYGGTAAALAFTGPGSYSLDHGVGLNWDHQPWWAIASIAVGVLAAIPPLWRRRQALHSAPTTEPSTLADNQPPLPQGDV